MRDAAIDTYRSRARGAPSLDGLADERPGAVKAPRRGGINTAAVAAQRLGGGRGASASTRKARSVRLSLAERLRGRLPRVRPLRVLVIAAFAVSLVAIMANAMILQRGHRVAASAPAGQDAAPSRPAAPPPAPAQAAAPAPTLPPPAAAPPADLDEPAPAAARPAHRDPKPRPEAEKRRVEGMEGPRRQPEKPRHEAEKAKPGAERPAAHPRAGHPAPRAAKAASAAGTDDPVAELLAEQGAAPRATAPKRHGRAAAAEKPAAPPAE